MIVDHWIPGLRDCMREMKRCRTIVACHEAGHAIVADKTGSTIEAIEVAWDKGCCRHLGPMRLSSSRERIKSVAITYAGHLAQIELGFGRAYCHNRVQPEGSDIEMIVRCLHGQAQWRQELRQGRRLALRIIRLYRQDIADLTLVLDRYGHLDQRGYADFCRYGRTLFLGSSPRRAALIISRLRDRFVERLPWKRTEPDMEAIMDADPAMMAAIVGRMFQLIEDR